MIFLFHPRPAHRLKKKCHRRLTRFFPFSRRETSLYLASLNLHFFWLFSRAGLDLGDKEAADRWIDARIKVSSRRDPRVAARRRSKSFVDKRDPLIPRSNGEIRPLCARSAVVNNVEGTRRDVRQQINQPSSGPAVPWILAVISVMAEALFVGVLRGSFPGPPARDRSDCLLFSSTALSITLKWPPRITHLFAAKSVSGAIPPDCKNARTRIKGPSSIDHERF